MQLLTLLLSLQAAYAAPLILLAQNRQEQRDRVQTEIDRRVAERTQVDTEFLARELAGVRLGLSDVASSSELEDHLERISEGSRTARRPPGRLEDAPTRTSAAGCRDSDRRPTIFAATMVTSSTVTAANSVGCTHGLRWSPQSSRTSAPSAAASARCLRGLHQAVSVVTNDAAG